VRNPHRNLWAAKVQSSVKWAHKTIHRQCTLIRAYFAVIIASLMNYKMNYASGKVNMCKFWHAITSVIPVDGDRWEYYRININSVCNVNQLDSDIWSVFMELMMSFVLEMCGHLCPAVDYRTQYFCLVTWIKCYPCYFQTRINKSLACAIFELQSWLWKHCNFNWLQW